MDNFIGVIGVFIAGIFAGAVNSVAGGGSLISFPALVAFVITQIRANATSAGNEIRLPPPATELTAPAKIPAMNTPITPIMLSI